MLHFCELLVWKSHFLLLQLPVGARLLRHQHGHHQLLHQSHHPLLHLQEVQKLLQGKEVPLRRRDAWWCHSEVTGSKVVGRGGFLRCLEIWVYLEESRERIRVREVATFDGRSVGTKRGGLKEHSNKSSDEPRVNTEQPKRKELHEAEDSQDMLQSNLLKKLKLTC